MSGARLQWLARAAATIAVCMHPTVLRHLSVPQPGTAVWRAGSNITSQVTGTGSMLPLPTNHEQHTETSLHALN